MIGFDEKIFDKGETIEIIRDTHIEFLKLKAGKSVDYARKREEFNLN